MSEYIISVCITLDIHIILRTLLKYLLYKQYSQFQVGYFFADLNKIEALDSRISLLRLKHEKQLDWSYILGCTVSKKLIIAPWHLLPSKIVFCFGALTYIFFQRIIAPIICHFDSSSRVASHHLDDLDCYHFRKVNSYTWRN